MASSSHERSKSKNKITEDHNSYASSTTLRPLDRSQSHIPESNELVWKNFFGYQIAVPNCFRRFACSHSSPTRVYQIWPGRNVSQIVKFSSSLQEKLTRRKIISFTFLEVKTGVLLPGESNLWPWSPRLSSNFSFSVSIWVDILQLCLQYSTPSLCPYNHCITFLNSGCKFIN